MKKSVLIALIVFIIAVEGGIWVYFNQSSSKKSTSQTTVSSNETATLANSETNTALPVDPQSPAINFVGVSYGFTGKLAAIKDTPTGKELSLKGYENAEFPKFLVLPTSKVYFRVNNVDTAAKSTNLRTGQNISISMTYDLRKKAWSLNNVRIVIPRQTPTSTPSSKPTIKPS